MNLATAPQSPPPAHAGRRRNVLLLTIDAWRSDFVDTFAGVPLLPALQPLWPHTLRFDHAYTSGPWTSPGIISMLTGESAPRHGVHYEWSAPRPDTPALPAQLLRAGYRVPNLCYLNRVGNYAGLGYPAAESPGYPTGPDDDLPLRALRTLHAQPTDAPWFAWYHYKYVHLPYGTSPSHRRLFGIDDAGACLPPRVRDSVAKLFVVPRADHPLQPEDRDVVQRLYAAGVRQMNDFLARIFAELDALHLWDDTTVVLTADHGDELLEHGHVGHASTSHYATLFEEVLRIPLIVIDTRWRAAQCSDRRVTIGDLFPTLLSLCGQDGGAAQSGTVGGAVDLSPLWAASPVQPAALTDDRILLFHSSRMGYQTPRRCDGQTVAGFSDGRQKYIYESYDNPRRLLFDLAADPAEQSPQTDGPDVDRAHARLLQFLAEAGR